MGATRRTHVLLRPFPCILPYKRKAYYSSILGPGRVALHFWHTPCNYPISNNNNSQEVTMKIKSKVKAGGEGGIMISIIYIGK